jgi:hypothetical protein
MEVLSSYLDLVNIKVLVIIQLRIAVSAAAEVTFLTYTKPLSVLPALSDLVARSS